MTAPVGATVRGYSRCPEYSEFFFPSDTFDLCRSLKNRLRMLHRLGSDGLGMTYREHCRMGCSKGQCAA